MASYAVPEHPNRLWRQTLSCALQMAQILFSQHTLRTLKFSAAFCIQRGSLPFLVLEDLSEAIYAFAKLGAPDLASWH